MENINNNNSLESEIADLEEKIFGANENNEPKENLEKLILDWKNKKAEWVDNEKSVKAVALYHLSLLKIYIRLGEENFKDEIDDTIGDTWDSVSSCEELKDLEMELSSLIGNA